MEKILGKKNEAIEAHLHSKGFKGCPVSRDFTSDFTHDTALTAYQQIPYKEGTVYAQQFSDFYRYTAMIPKSVEVIRRLI